MGQTLGTLEFPFFFEEDSGQQLPKSGLSILGWYPLLKDMEGFKGFLSEGEFFVRGLRLDEDCYENSKGDFKACVLTLLIS
ncbi:hypothetical protein CEXT_202521 [Caerostris extrusa]|uniref:Uncharacterized protein n=1 Tax=Caerostris extrusa TaxID=172846 RepID=A0AAV4W7J2_CAEEX|nr:hypothetical protein CEXT_202521 [Caerostris extrusa]